MKKQRENDLFKKKQGRRRPSKDLVGGADPIAQEGKNQIARTTLLSEFRQGNVKE